MELNSNQKSIYNLYLSTYRTYNNKPYTIRQNFDNFDVEEPEKYKNILRIEKLFITTPAINKKLYFKAPYEIYKNDKHFDLKYFASQSAIKSYNLYLKEIEEKSPDSPSQIDFIKDSLFHVRDYCVSNKIPLKKYIIYDGTNISPQWAVDIVSNNISIYFLIGFEYFGFNIKKFIDENILPDEIEMFFGNSYINYENYKNRLDNSTKAKKLIIEGIKTITKYINEQLKK